MSKNANFGGEMLQNTSGNIVLRKLGGEPTIFGLNVTKKYYNIRNSCIFYNILPQTLQFY